MKSTSKKYKLGQSTEKGKYKTFTAFELDDIQLRYLKNSRCLSQPKVFIKK